MKKLAYLYMILIMLFAPITPLIIANAVDGASTASSPNLIANPSAETVVASSPSDWLTNTWGTNSASFSLINPGNSGNTALRTEVTEYTSGDAKWHPIPVAVMPNETYTFSEYYRSNVSTEVVIQFTNTDGSNTYPWLQTAPSASAWSLLSYEIVIPANTSKLSVFHVVNTVGWLEIDDFKLNQAVNPVCEDSSATNTGGSLPCSYPPSSDGNLVLNPSLEQTNSQSTAPLNWVSNSWGTNTAAFTYDNSGRTGSKSVRTNVTSYTSGDAKWYFAPVAVTAGEIYDYSHFYKSSAASEAVIQFTNTSGVASYAYVGSLPVSANWSEFKTEITIPAGIAKLSMFHVLATAGQLSLDDASLIIKEVVPSTNPVPNNSLETASGSNPAQWNKNNWGTNTASFTYPSEGRTGQKSVKVTISNYSSGDAKWIFSPISLNPGQEYQFSAWYKTNVVPNVVAMFTDANGGVSYQGLPTPQPAANSATIWQEYKDTFTMPSEAVSASIFMFINKVGWVQTDDYKISDYQAQGFNRALVSLTFDDGHEINTLTALPIMQSHGFVSTQCYATTFIEDADNEQTAINSVLQFRDAGHEICSHTVTHPFLTQLTTAQATYELSHSQQYLQSITDDPILNFASPYGDYNAGVNNIIDNYYQSHRTVDEGYNSKNNFDIYRIKVQNMLSTTTIEEFQGWLDHAAATNTWLVLVYHRVANDPDTYETYTSDFVEQMQVLEESGLLVKTYNDALAELIPQL